MDIPASFWAVEWPVLGGGLATGMAAIFSFLLVAKPKGTLWYSVFGWRVWWLAFSAVIHLWVEGQFVFYRGKACSVCVVKGQDLYGDADFRYGRTLEAGTAAMEAITVLVEGPLCLLVAYAMVTKAKWQHPLQVILTTMQLYGLVWFVLQPAFAEAPQVSSDPFLLYGIVWLFNAPWAVMPAVLLWESVRSLAGGSQGGRKPQPAAAARQPSQPVLQGDGNKPRRRNKGGKGTDKN